MVTKWELKTIMYNGVYCAETDTHHFIHDQEDGELVASFLKCAVQSITGNGDKYTMGTGVIITIKEAV